MSPESSLEDTLGGLSVHSDKWERLGVQRPCLQQGRTGDASISGQNTGSWDRVTQLLQFMRAKLLKTVEWEGIT